MRTAAGRRRFTYLRGRGAERVALLWLMARGYRPLARRYAAAGGEIDLVMRRGDTIAFVEVKAVRAGSRVGPERPVLWVTPRKQTQVRRLATAWMAERRGSVPRYAEIRFDAIGIVLGPHDEVVDLEHLSGAF